jgi:hypothetical protein
MLRGGFMGGVDYDTFQKILTTIATIFGIITMIIDFYGKLKNKKRSSSKKKSHSRY